MTRVAILVDGPDWHTRRLAEAFARLGTAAAVLSLQECAFVLGEGGTGMAYLCVDCARQLMVEPVDAAPGGTEADEDDEDDDNTDAAIS